jgi:hypothetical protein
MMRDMTLSVFVGIVIGHGRFPLVLYLSAHTQIARIKQ